MHAFTKVFHHSRGIPEISSRRTASSIFVVLRNIIVLGRFLKTSASRSYPREKRGLGRARGPCFRRRDQATGDQDMADMRSDGKLSITASCYVRQDYSNKRTLIVVLLEFDSSKLKWSRSKKVDRIRPKTLRQTCFFDITGSVFFGHHFQHNYRQN